MPTSTRRVEDLSVVAFVQNPNTLEVLHLLECTSTAGAIGVVAGRVLDERGNAVQDQPVTCCDDEECQTGRTDENGRYRFTGLTYNPRKVISLAPMVRWIFYRQEVGEFRPEAHLNYFHPEENGLHPAASGGTAILASGALRITAVPGSLEYGIGVDHALRAVQMNQDGVPPFVLAPMRQPHGLYPTPAAAFLINPLKVKSTASIDVAMNEAVTACCPPMTRRL